MRAQGGAAEPLRVIPQQSFVTVNQVVQMGGPHDSLGKHLILEKT